jgi:hypothetical protein
MVCHLDRRVSFVSCMIRVCSFSILISDSNTSTRCIIVKLNSGKQLFITENSVNEEVSEEDGKRQATIGFKERC